MQVVQLLAGLGLHRAAWAWSFDDHVHGRHVHALSSMSHQQGCCGAHVLSVEHAGEAQVVGAHVRMHPRFFKGPLLLLVRNCRCLCMERSRVERHRTWMLRAAFRVYVY